MVETRGGAAPNDLTWHKKNCGGGEEKERERRDILLSFLMSLTAIRLTSRLGRNRGKEAKGREKEAAGTGRIILTFPFLSTKLRGPCCHLHFQQHISPF